MKRSHRLQPVVKVAENSEQEAAQLLGETQLALTQAEQRMVDLGNYRTEYLSRFHAAGAMGMSAVKMADYRLFLANLDRAITEQTLLVQQAASLVEQQRTVWFDQRGKVKMLDNVVARYQADEQRVADRKEQSDQDERSQRRPKIR
ncbi:MAG: flagellar export protein FliJ [Ectothiorhodospiraceae bacterium]|nr:flagellar export protein FliJ [Ectothiorhodospiraceae bacterium]